MNEGALSPLCDRLWIEPVTLAQLLGRSFRSLYCRSDGVRGRGAAVKYLSHNRSRSFGSVRLIPSQPGTKHLRWVMLVRLSACASNHSIIWRHQLLLPWASCKANK